MDHFLYSIFQSGQKTLLFFEKMDIICAKCHLSVSSQVKSQQNKTKQNNSVLFQKEIITQMNKWIKQPFPSFGDKELHLNTKCVLDKCISSARAASIIAKKTTNLRNELQNAYKSIAI